MAELIDDEVVDTFAVVGPLRQLAEAVRQRFDGVVDRFCFYTPYATDPDEWAEVIKDFKG